MGKSLVEKSSACTLTRKQYGLICSASCLALGAKIRPNETVIMDKNKEAFLVI